MYIFVCVLYLLYLLRQDLPNIKHVTFPHLHLDPFKHLAVVTELEPARTYIKKIESVLPEIKTYTFFDVYHMLLFRFVLFFYIIKTDLTFYGHWFNIFGARYLIRRHIR